MKKLLMICAALALVTFAPSCKEEKGCMDAEANNYNPDAEEDDGSCAYTAGTGGEFTIVAFPEHHGNPIVSDSVHLDSAWVKFNTSNSPGTDPADYDLIVVGEPGEAHVHIEGLKRGSYFIYMTGWDPNASPNRVAGGIPYMVTQKSGETDLVVPVVE